MTRMALRVAAKTLLLAALTAGTWRWPPLAAGYLLGAAHATWTHGRHQRRLHAELKQAHLHLAGMWRLGFQAARELAAHQPDPAPEWLAPFAPNGTRPDLN